MISIAILYFQHTVRPMVYPIGVLCCISFLCRNEIGQARAAAGPDRPGQSGEIRWDFKANRLPFLNSSNQDFLVFINPKGCHSLSIQVEFSEMIGLFFSPFCPFFRSIRERLNILYKEPFLEPFEIGLSFSRLEQSSEEKS